MYSRLHAVVRGIVCKWYNDKRKQCEGMRGKTHWRQTNEKMRMDGNASAQTHHILHTPATSLAFSPQIHLRSAPIPLAAAAASTSRNHPPTNLQNALCSADPIHRGHKVACVVFDTVYV